MKPLACLLVALAGLAFAAPAKADHDYYPVRHRYSVHCNCYQCVSHRGYYYRGYRHGYHPRSYYRPRPYRRYYRPYYGRRYYRDYYRGFSFRSPRFSLHLGY